MINMKNFFNLSLQDKPYTTKIESLQDNLNLIKVYIEGFVILSSPEMYNDLTLVKKTILDAWNHIFSREIATLENENLPLFNLKKTFKLSFYEYLCLLLSLSIELDQNLGKTYHSICGKEQPSFYVAFCFFGMTESIESHLFKNSNLNTSHLQYLFNCDAYDYSPSSLMHYPMCLRKSVLLYLTGNLTMSHMPYYTFFNGIVSKSYVALHDSIFNQLLSYLSRSLSALPHYKQVILLHGPKGVGKQTIVKRICHHLHLTCFFVNMEMLEALDEVHFKLELNELCFKLLINSSLICLSGSNQENPTKRYTILLEKIKSFVKYVFITFNKLPTISLNTSLFKLLELEVSDSALSEKLLIWTYLKEKYALTIDPKNFASKYHLTIGTLEKIMATCTLLAHYEGTLQICEKHLVKAILSHNKMTSNTSLVKYPYTFDDLVLDSKTSTSLRHICNYVKNRYTIFEEWGFSSKLAYGKGISMLFYGSPGTGKTMCASVLANEWGLDLVKVDLSQVIDKYIGETEKRLDAIFENAKQNNCVLFFDEADALFSKRTDIQSSHDKYANIEVSHLLQKIEVYEGIVILATNLVQNFDDAFKRRIQFMLRFSLPTSEIRLLLWQKAFPSKAPLHEDVDFDFLAEKFELSPSIIKSTALYAAFLAHIEGDTICIKHIIESIRVQYEKDGRLMPH